MYTVWSATEQRGAHNASVCGQVEILEEVKMDKGKGCG